MGRLVSSALVSGLAGAGRSRGHRRDKGRAGPLVSGRMVCWERRQVFEQEPRVQALGRGRGLVFWRRGGGQPLDGLGWSGNRGWPGYVNGRDWAVCGQGRGRDGRGRIGGRGVCAGARAVGQRERGKREAGGGARGLEAQRGRAGSRQIKAVRLPMSRGPACRYG